MSAGADELRERVRSPYAEAALAAEKPTSCGCGTSCCTDEARDSGCCGDECCGRGTPGDFGEALEAGLTSVGLANVSVTFTHEVADGMHAAIVRASKPS